MRDVRVAAVLALGLVAACAKGSAPGSDIDAPPGGVDAPPGGVDAAAIDAAPDAAIDAATIDTAMIDARPVDASVPDAATTDAPMTIDAPMATDAPVDACVPITTQRLTNPALDNTPMGTGWVQQPFDVMYPPITDDTLNPPAPAVHTAPYKIWLGGFTSASDAVYQDVAIPAGTTSLVLHGVYWVGTDETIAGVYDHAYVELTNTSGTVLETALSISDDTVTGGWTNFSKTFVTNYSGQTIRIRLRSTNDSTDVTSFWFDTLALDRTGCP